MSNTEAMFAEPERVALIGSIAAKVSSFTEANADITFRTTWACMWLADIECLRELDGHSSSNLFATLRPVEERRIVQTWTRAATQQDRKIRRGSA
ncbi:hypothetical protein SI65_09401 [Aspergillus cristatus]|uniref:Uncharacterized protein n=1 Tax=Aspergillus cristatus TaxID=573508 RepID=A0A1E3B2I7_ASPCR|nr:hypothetical protein SI65_09401 [Aspergillus cristatus]